MAITSALVLFAGLWFLVLFCVLPIRLQSQGDAGEVEPGTHVSAPANPQIKKRALITTGITIVLWAILVWVITTEVITIRDFDWMGRMDPPASS
ncbi:MAG: DUF1467 family protein [Halocynthiibacter sp.]